MMPVQQFIVMHSWVQPDRKVGCPNWFRINVFFICSPRTMAWIAFNAHDMQTYISSPMILIVCPKLRNALRIGSMAVYVWQHQQSQPDRKLFQTLTLLSQHLGIYSNVSVGPDPVTNRSSHDTDFVAVMIKLNTLQTQWLQRFRRLSIRVDHAQMNDSGSTRISKFRHTTISLFSVPIWHFVYSERSRGDNKLSPSVIETNYSHTAGNCNW